MSETVTRVLECPNCGAPLAPPRFARTVACSFCRSVVQVDPRATSVHAFRAALARWNNPATYGCTDFLTIGTTHWELRDRIAQGDISDVFPAERVRWPSERVLVKLLRDEKDAPFFDREAHVLQTLQQSTAAGAAHFTTLVPQPVTRGTVADGPFHGRRAAVYRWSAGFRHTLATVRRLRPAGVEPQAAVWIWRRLLEMLAFLHRSGVVHGGVLPPHVLVEEGEHGVRLVGYGSCDESGALLPSLHDRYRDFFPQHGLSPRSDVAMSARVVAYVLGGEVSDGAASDGAANPGKAATVRLPAAVPTPLADLIRRIAADGSADAWSLRETVGQTARALFGPPRFHPLILPP